MARNTHKKVDEAKPEVRPEDEIKYSPEQIAEHERRNRNADKINKKTEKSEATE